jgi:haloalkane dehalogenase
VQVVHTPESGFADLPDYPFHPAYVDIVDRALDGLRMHYVDAGPRAGPVVLLLHGQPTWSYLYRHVIAGLADAGLRAIAPDLIGYGRSSKPTDRTVYSLASHIRWLRSFVAGLDVHDVTLVCQDWGGPIGLGVLAAEPERFARVLATNTILHTADPALAGRLDWAVHGLDGAPRVVVEEMLLDYIFATQRYPLVPSTFVSAATVTDLPPDVLAAYDAPFPDEEHRAGLRQMSVLIPVTRTDPGAAINRATTEVLRGWTKPFRTAYSDSDPATRGWADVLGEFVPGARGQPHVTIPGAGHFVQEDDPTGLTAAIVDFIGAGPASVQSGR